MCRSPSSALLVLAMLVSACGGPQRPPPDSCSAAKTVVGDQQDIEQIAACTELGTLVIRSGAELSLAPLELERVRGDLLVGPTVNLEELRLPELREVEGRLEVASNSLLRAVFLPRLERAGEISITGNTGVVTVSTPVLTSVRKSLVIESLPSLEFLDASKLASVGQALVIARNPLLELIELPATIRAGELQLDENRALSEETIRDLRTRVSTRTAN